MLSICTAPRDVLGFPGYLTGLLTIRPHHWVACKKGQEDRTPTGLSKARVVEGVNTLEAPVLGLERVGVCDRGGGRGIGSS